NFLVRPIGMARFAADAGAAAGAAAAPTGPAGNAGFDSRRPVVVFAAWMLVLAPLAWGVLQTIRKAALLFG
ncbi:MAG TPA: hypothetical protein VMQ62_05170, partial [Dongiaceae bacterium]|nr:hypothetical protein [Dongiaceae bacterium]